jgi:hypothetical protein
MKLYLSKLDTEYQITTNISDLCLGDYLPKVVPFIIKEVGCFKTSINPIVKAQEEIIGILMGVLYNFNLDFVGK